MGKYCADFIGKFNYLSVDFLSVGNFNWLVIIVEAISNSAVGVLKCKKIVGYRL